jgi:hypothetical protein
MREMGRLERGCWCELFFIDEYFMRSAAHAYNCFLLQMETNFANRLCTGGTLTMAPNPYKDGALSPVPGALTDYLKSMVELTNDKMPDVVVHEYSPLLDSSDMGPPDWALLGKTLFLMVPIFVHTLLNSSGLLSANDIKSNYLHCECC